MAIRALNSAIVANYNTAASGSWLAGDALFLQTDGTVAVAYRAGNGFSTLPQQTGRFVGFSADDTARTGNTMILADPVGANYVDSSNVVQSNNNGFYVVSKRAIGDFLAENVNGVTNAAQTDGGSAWSPAPGDLLTIAAVTANAGKLAKLTTPGTDGLIVGRVDSYDSAAGLLYFTQLAGGA